MTIPRNLGLYYLLHSAPIMPAVVIGGLLWTLAPRMAFVIAWAFGIVSTFVFNKTERERFPN